MTRLSLCPCTSTLKYSQCCEPFLSYQKKPRTAEQLMRSRYCAFVTQNAPYLLNTWDESKRPKTLDFDQQAKWFGLKVKKCKAGQASDTYGWVEFVARYKVNGKAERVEELSYFVKQADQWLYVSAETKSWDTL